MAELAASKGLWRLLGSFVDYAASWLKSSDIDHLTTKPQQQSSQIELPFSSLPAEKTHYFTQSSYFSRHRELPDPVEVRFRGKVQSIGKSFGLRPLPVDFTNLGLLVKWGRHITIAEGQCMWAVQQVFKKDRYPFLKSMDGVRMEMTVYLHGAHRRRYFDGSLEWT